MEEEEGTLLIPHLDTALEPGLRIDVVGGEGVDEGELGRGV